MALPPLAIGASIPHLIRARRRAERPYRASSGERVMGFFSWIILGLISGFIANRLVSGSGAGFLMDILIGIVGAVVGGYLGSRLGFGGLEGLSLWSIVLSVVGAIIVLVIYRAVASRA
jgi:uncharacterized membrane protein YeaQ/YmgE (transglycosylase-associated protein family)